MFPIGSVCGTRTSLAALTAAGLLLGLATLVLSIVSPLDSLGSHHFFMHMTQHVLIMLVGTAMPLREGNARPQPGLHETSVIRGTVQSASDTQLALIPDEDQAVTRQAGMRLTFVLTPQTQLLWGTQRLAAA